jgi:hypothetical protein
MIEPTLQPAEDAPPPLPEAEQARIEFLFRAERRHGLIHPLQHIVQRYRAEARSELPGDAA